MKILEYHIMHIKASFIIQTPVSYSTAPRISSLLHSCLGLATYWRMCKCSALLTSLQFTLIENSAYYHKFDQSLAYYHKFDQSLAYYHKFDQSLAYYHKFDQSLDRDIKQVRLYIQIRIM